jgi:diguanylate cyclase (GGDEF)-like protein/PAS domain S-box-containing protein
MISPDNALVSLDHHIDLTACEQEPIHTPGAIQPQGVLLVAGLDTFIITHVSENLDLYLGVKPDAALGRPLHEMLGEAACDAIRSALESERYAPCVVLAVTTPRAPFPLQMVFHRTGGSVYIELEVAPQSGNRGLVIQRTQAIMHALHAASSQRELCDIVVTKLRALTGYDRVMVYRFDREGNGEVIAEDRERDLEPYLGLHYPASDIPPQARRMCLAQRVRAIADVDYVPVPLLANPALGQTPQVDMTLCALRSVSPTHLEYMRNMGTRASLGVSLIPSTSLWGLLVCHHRSPLIITADLRAQCDLLGQLMSLLLGSVGEAESYAEQLRRQRTLHEVVARVTEFESVADALLASGDAILSMLDASGAVIRLGERTVTLGLTPPIEAATRAMTVLRTGSDDDLITIDELQECVPDWSAESANASGALYLTLPSGPDDAIIWFRREIEREIKWGGDPTKAVDPDPTTGRLSPRRSFALWCERVAGHSMPWQEADRATAREIRRTITKALARQALAELAKLRYYDPLTQLPNRRMLQERLDGLGTASDVALLFLDLDRFKAVNDTRGHAAGDSMLLQVAARVTKAVRSGDLVARVGGDEFVVLCLNTSVVAAEALAARLRQDLAVPFVIGEHHVFAGGSVGVAHTDTTETPKLLDAADLAMYIDKRQKKRRAAAPEARPTSAAEFDRPTQESQPVAETTNECQLVEAPADTQQFARSLGHQPSATERQLEVQEQRRLNNARFWLAAIAECSEDAIIGKDLEGIITSWNRAAEVIFGYVADEIIGKSINLIIPPDRFDEEVSIRQQIRAGKKIAHFETKRLSKSGAIIPISLTISPICDDQGRLIGASKIARDCSERDVREEKLHTANVELKRLARHLAEQHACFGTALDNMSQGLMMFDRSKMLLLFNAAALTIFALRPGALQPGMAFIDIIRAVGDVGNLSADIGTVVEFYRRMFEQNLPRKFTLVLPAGRHLMAIFIPYESGYLVTFDDVTDMHRFEERILHLVMHDALTGLPNRMLLDTRIDEALAKVCDDRDGFAVMYLDLDNFKGVNNLHGHPTGDKVLSEVAKRIQSVVPRSDLVARLDGEEFAIVATDDEAGITALASRLVEVVGAPYDIDGQMVVIGTSIGIAMAPADGTSPDTLIKNANLALYRAKTNGRGCYAFFESSMEQQLADRRRVEIDLRNALVLGELELYYQPIVKVVSRRIVGFEALMRWRHPTRGMVPPEAFIPIAEENGFIVQIGQWALKTACLEAARWPVSLKVAVNLSSVQFRTSNLADTVAAALAASGLSANRLELEITESTVMQDPDATLAIINVIKGFGVRLAMDDFGTGYSSIANLQRFPFDKVKIDQSFVRDIGKASNLAIIRAATSIADSMGLETTAEGVETEEQFALVALVGCSEFQGFLFSQPRPASEIMPMLAQERALTTAARACSASSASPVLPPL